MGLKEKKQIYRISYDGIASSSGCFGRIKKGVLFSTGRKTTITYFNAILLVKAENVLFLVVHRPKVPLQELIITIGGLKHSI
jgi:hypothetical protein